MAERPENPKEGDSYRDSDGIQFMWINGSWHQMTRNKGNLKRGG